MTWANVHAATGSIIGTYRYLVVSPLADVWSNRTYTGSDTGVYFGPLDYIDMFAAASVGLDVPVFRAMHSGFRTRIRDAIRATHRDVIPSGGANWQGDRLINYVGTNTFRNRQWTTQQNTNYGLPAGCCVPAELVSGIIPEWAIAVNGTITYSQTRIDKINRAKNKMGWSWTKTIDAAKGIRRERSRGIGGVFDDFIRLRNLGVSANNVVRRLI